MDLKKICKAILFPHIAILICLLPIATVLLVYSMVFVGSESIIAYVSYVLSAYTLTVWCIRIPSIVKSIKKFKTENKYARLWLEDVHLRVRLSLYGSLLWNVAYAILQLGLGFYHSSFWFFSLAGYYISLAFMRFFLARYARKNGAGENLRAELMRYRICGIVFLVMNLSLSLMIFFMIYWGRTFDHHEITTIAMAAYTFTSFTFAIINTVKYRKYESPVYSATKAISLAAASVSMLTLESSMLSAFGASMENVHKNIFLGASGGAISIFIIVMAVFMIMKSTKRLKQLNVSKEKINGKQ